MRYPLLVLLGTGTGVGKTHLACAILHWASARGLPLVAYKPLESGGLPDAESDAGRLAAASTFHVKPPPTLRYAAELAPVYAAELEQQHVPTDSIRIHIDKLRQQAPVLLELPGGALSPFDQRLTNADLVGTLGSTHVVLAANNALGVLHAVLSTQCALRAHGAPAQLVLLSAPEVPDSSTSRNAKDLAHWLGPCPIATLPRAAPEALVPWLPDEWLIETLTAKAGVR